MDELAILGIVGSFVLGNGVGALIWHAYRPPEVIKVLVNAETLEPMETEHVHQAISVDPTGWHCACGLHYHRYIHGKCACGVEGEADEWQTT